jgi:chromosome transmission fidelity protein 18
MCKFHVVELNASEDLRNERNQLLMENALDFEPVFGRRTRPLLVLEEMDGIGTISDAILKSVMNLTGRPVVIVVNDAYSANMRAVRAQAKIIRIPPPPQPKFLARLRKIADIEQIRISGQALADLAEMSRFDMRTALNTLQFLAVRQPITPELLQLLQVGVRNSNLNPFDVWKHLFTDSTPLEDSLRILESFAGNPLIAMGALDNMERVQTPDPNGRKMCEFLDDLCYTDRARGDLGNLGLAGMPKTRGIPRLGTWQLMWPTALLGKDAQARRNEELLRKNPVWREHRDLIELYLNPSQQVINMLSGRLGAGLRDAFVAFHKRIKVRYTKNSVGHYHSEPDIDSLLGFDEVGTVRLTRFRELIQYELEREEHVKKARPTGLTATEKLKSRETVKHKDSVDFWGRKVEGAATTQVSRNQRSPMIYKYNEGTTNAVRRPVYLPRFLLIL